MQVEDAHELAPGLIRRELDEGAIVVYELSTVRPEVIELGEKNVRETLRAYGIKKAYLALYDVSALNIMASGNLRERLATLNSIHPEVRGRSAVLFSRSPLTVGLQAFVRLLRSDSRPKRVFFSYEEALEWLRDYRDEGLRDR